MKPTLKQKHQLKQYQNNERFSVILSDFELRMSFRTLFPNEKNVPTHKRIVTLSLMIQHKLEKEFGVKVRVWRDNNVADKFTKKGSHYNFLVNADFNTHTIKNILNTFKIMNVKKGK